VSISYRTATGRSGRYTPDFLVAYRNDDRILYEVKYRADLKKDWPTLKPRLRVGLRYAREHGMRFAIMTEVEIRGPYLSNVRFLRQFMAPTRNVAIEEQLVSTLAVLGETTPKALLMAAYWTDENRIKAMRPLWRLIALGRVQADLFHPLSMTTPIWVTVGEDYIWQDPHSYRSNPVR
jgi:hypothetical protein